MSWSDEDPEPRSRLWLGVTVAVLAVIALVVAGVAIGERSHVTARISNDAVSATTPDVDPSTSSPPSAAPSTSASVAAPASAIVAPNARSALTSTATARPQAPATTRPAPVAVVPAGLTNPPPAQAPTASAAADEVGLVDVDAVLGFDDEISSGTGMILTSTGQVLTNNHVIIGATSITITVIATGQTYAATVVGADPTDDVAVLQATSVSGLTVAVFGDSTTVAIGDAVIGVGNAGGVGGTPTAAPGTVLALNVPVTATLEGSGNVEHLLGLIASNAQIQPGDSGGPLFNRAQRIIGLDTAAGKTPSGEIIAFSIPINAALSIAHQIQQGISSSTIKLGSPAFLGVTAVDAPAGSGASVQQVLLGTPAAAAGIAANDIITKLNGTSVTSAASLAAVLNSLHSGDQVTISWTRTTPAGTQTFTATEVLVDGPAV